MEDRGVQANKVTGDWPGLLMFIQIQILQKYVKLSEITLQRNTVPLAKV